MQALLLHVAAAGGQVRRGTSEVFLLCVCVCVCVCMCVCVYVCVCVCVYVYVYISGAARVQ